MATISLEREVKLTNEDAKIAMSAKPTEKYNRLVRDVVASKRKKSKTIPSWMSASNNES
ncbi:hypothetical protein GCM10011482_12980 [Enterococcus alcedinis]|uniref:Uncharacterized protein n=1 Tax=Enterococcus alcedinis TaxID=1274384 RepID=A0A917N533_9ENTE|nr:hypothetical protein [Enterococcus alcedinis]MBP2102082.1 hypothetical protein [Enterococcus alcedinis]GGI65644.1 hypothetical protein GCM10011482_12980 [Enterococcus alcedinis]